MKIYFIEESTKWPDYIAGRIEVLDDHSIVGELRVFTKDEMKLNAFLEQYEGKEMSANIMDRATRIIKETLQDKLEEEE